MKKKELILKDVRMHLSSALNMLEGDALPLTFMEVLGAAQQAHQAAHILHRLAGRIEVEEDQAKGIGGSNDPLKYVVAA